MALISQALTTMKNARLELNLYSIVNITATETLTANTAMTTFSFAHADILPSTLGIFSQGTGSAAVTLATSTITADLASGTISFTASMSGSITCSLYSYYAWDYTSDMFVERLINVNSEKISKYCGRKFIANSYSEMYKGLGSNTRLVLNQFPINSISSIKVNSSALTAGTDYDTANSTYLEQGFIVKEDGWTWYGYSTGLVPELASPVDNVEVNYSAGYTLATLPPDIEDACLRLVAASYNEKEMGSQGVSNLRQGNLSYTFNDNIPLSILNSLDAYKRAVL